jgi:hypothetical protein
MVPSIYPVTGLLCVRVRVFAQSLQFFSTFFDFTFFAHRLRAHGVDSVTELDRRAHESKQPTATPLTTLFAAFYLGTDLGERCRRAPVLFR